MWENYRLQLWTQYGFRDAFNLNVNWWDTDVIGIDQGPIIIMIENYRNQNVWNRFMANPDVQRGLQRAGFTPITGVEETHVPAQLVLSQNYPNPFNPSTTIEFQIPHTSHVSLKVFDVLGKEVAMLVNETKHAGTYTVSFDAGKLSSGIYFYKLNTGSFVQIRKMILTK
jgi:hypothetical protein